METVYVKIEPAVQDDPNCIPLQEEKKVGNKQFIFLFSEFVNSLAINSHTKYFNNTVNLLNNIDPAFRSPFHKLYARNIHY